MTNLEKPLVDKREYRHCQIGHDATKTSSATLDVLLISDPETDKASAAIDIHVGQLCDGDLQGLAHYCEHMLFIGTEKYPTENAYDQFLTTHGGSSNAFTDLEHTCYYFDVQARDLEGALDRFAQCFIGPLFTQSALEREVQAVDSEHHKNLQQDLWRMHQLSKSKIAPSDHPLAAFGSGNQESLPMTNIREQLLEFFQSYYRQSLSLYKLVVLGKDSLDDLEKMVHRYFDDLTESLAPAPYASESSPNNRETLVQSFFPKVSEWQVPQRLHVVPVTQVHAVELQFPMPSQLDHWQSKPTRYLSHLIGHEGQGSLLSLLKAKDYAIELYADDASRSCVQWNIFTIKIELTELGLQEVDEVVEIIFAYVDLLKTEGPKEWIQNELQTVGDLQFRFLSQRNPMDFTSSVAGWMQLYPPSSYLSGPYRVRDWNPQAVVECLEAINPENMLLMLSSPKFSDSLTTPQTEKWYGTQYESVSLEEKVQTLWREAAATDYPALQLPQINDMIATNFDLLDSGFRNSVPNDAPQCILKLGQSLQLWYKPDNIFEMPKVNMLFSFQSSIANATAQSLVSTELFVEVFQEQVNEFTYLASMAGLHCEAGLTHASGGIELHVTGYHHKAHVLMEKMMDALMELVVNEDAFGEDQDIFRRVVFKTEQHYQSFLVAQPYQHAIYGGDLVLEQGKYTISQKLLALQQVARCPKTVVEHALKFWKDCRLKALVHGNVTPKHAKELTEGLWQKLEQIRGEDHKSMAEQGNNGMDPSSALSALFQRRVVQLEPGSSYLYRFEEFNPSNTNSCLQIILQLGKMELIDNATLAFVHHLIKEPAFNQLRTEEQLGYIVHTSIKTSGDNIKGLLFLIQSDSFDPIHVEGRVEDFISKFRKRIQAMAVEDFETNVQSVVASFLEKNKNLGEESSRYWHVMMNQTYHFKRLQEIAECVKTITKDRVLIFFDKYLAASAPCRRKFCVQVFAKQHQERMKDSVTPGVTMVKDPAEFQRSMYLYPLPKTAGIEVVELG